MKKIPLFLILLVLVYSSTFKRLDSFSPAYQKLTSSDQVVSTLGKYQFQLVQAGCKLKIFRFDQIRYTYNQIDTYNSSLSDCTSLNANKGQIITNNGKVFANLSSNDFAKTSMTIDDNGVIRLIAIKNNTNQYQLPQTQQKIIYSVPSALQNHRFIKAVSQADLANYSADLSNQNAWNFIIANGSLTISKGTTLSQTFPLQNLNLTRSGIYDQNKRSPPYADITNAMLFPRCDSAKSSCQVLSPYALEFNQYWPVLRIYDQQRYLIAEYAFGKQNKFNQAQICPQATFLFGSSCVTSCPSPYYQRINGIYGQCVLTCPQGAIKNTDTKSCGCSNSQLNQNAHNTQTIKGCQANSTAYFYGCDCSISNSSFDRRNSLVCQQSTKCPNSTYPSEGLCMNCGQQCLKCDIDSNSIRYLKCISCQNNYQLVNGQCVPIVSTCPGNCLVCDGQVCNKCAPFYSLLNGACVQSCDSSLYKQIYTAKNGSMCTTISSYQSGNTGIPCPLSCQTCIQNGDKCTSCIDGYILFVSPLAVTCKLNGPNFSCDSSDYVYDSKRQVCMAKNVQSLKMNQCLKKIRNCKICGYNQDETCTLCQDRYFLHQNTCVAKCPNGFTNNLNACVPSISSCSRQTLKTNEHLVNVNTDTIKNSQSYSRYINNGLEPANDPSGYNLYARQNYLQQSTNNQTVQTQVTTASPVCLQCSSGFGLSEDGTSCIKCPSTCRFECYYARQNSCYKPTIKCTFLSQQGQCLESCQEGTYPFINSSNVAICRRPTSNSDQDKYVKVDAASYPQPDGSRIYYFVLGTKLINPSANMEVGSFGDSKNSRMLVTSAVAPTFTDGQYYEFNNTNQNGAVIVIDNNINQFRTAFGFTLANSVYGVINQQSHQQFMRDWLAFIGYVLAWIILLIHCIYIGNTILYKADNLIIFCQTIYYFSFVQLLVGNYLAQYYYGWSWMHMKFFPNYFAQTIPSQYNERQAPLSYKLATLDANFIRNAGFSISIFITFLVAWFIVSLGAFLISKFLKKTQIWYSRIAKNSLLAAIQLLSMNLFFFSVTQLISGGQYEKKYSGFHDSCQAAAIFFICIICLYTVVRFFFSRNGGIYMLKRIFIATILADAYENEGYVALLVAVELVFLIVRYFILEKPKMYKQKIVLVVQEFLYIIAYFLLFFVTLTGVNVVILSLIIFLLILALVWDLMDVYLDSKNEYLQEDWFGKGNQNNSKQNVPDTQRKMNE